MTTRTSVDTASLTAKQVRLFRTFGFLHVPGVFSDLLEATDSAMKRESARVPHRLPADGSLSMVGVVERDDTLSRRLLADDSCCRLARDLLGSDVVYQGSEAVVDDTAPLWERRVPQPGALVLTYCLETRGRRSGALRFLPRTHLPNTGWDDATGALREPLALLGLSPEDVPCSIVETAPGDLLAFDPYVFHAALGGTTGRRRISLRYAAVRPDRS